MLAGLVNILDDGGFHIWQNHGPFQTGSRSTSPLTDTNSVFHRGSVSASQWNNGDHSGRVYYVKTALNHPWIRGFSFHVGQ